MPHGIHAKTQTGFRFPDGLLVRLKARAERDNQTMTEITELALTRYLDQRDADDPPDTADPVPE